MSVAMDEVRRYIDGPFRSIQGWCIAQLWQAIEPLSLALAEMGPVGPVAEIGVFHGKFFIGLVKTAKAPSGNTAIDVFDLQQFNLDKAGEGNLARFKENLRTCGIEERAVTTVRADSMALSRFDVDEIRRATGGFSMFSVDGCHLVEHTINDVRLAMELTRPNGLVFLDDYYNPNWPGVQEGAAKLFLMDAPRFVPLVFTCNKLILCNISFHAHYLKTVVAFVKANHPTTRIKLVKRFGYETVTLIPDVKVGAALAPS